MLKEVRGVYGSLLDVPLAMYQRAGVGTKEGWDSLVTPQGVRAASDRWERARPSTGTQSQSLEDRRWRMDQLNAALGASPDIDTLWGSVPGGGALAGYGAD